jgi:hypothetical protein
MLPKKLYWLLCVEFWASLEPFSSSGFLWNPLT